MKKITEIVVLSGKGGTGKTTLSACLADIMENKVLADCDVDAANMHILLKPAQSESHIFKGMPIAYVNPAECSHCGTCQSLCRFDALVSQQDHIKVDPLSCEGCGLCKVACLKGAIEMKEPLLGILKTLIRDHQVSLP